MQTPFSRHEEVIRSNSRRRLLLFISIAALVILMILPCSSSAELKHHAPSLKLLKHLRLLRTPLAPALDPPRLVGWRGGESMTFSVKIAGVESARAAISLSAPSLIRDVSAIKMRGLSETLPFISLIHRVREEVITLVDLSGVLPLHVQEDRQAPGKNRKIEVSFNRRVVQQIQSANGSGRLDRGIPPPCWDPITALYYLRSIPLAEKMELPLLVLNGLTLYRVKLEVKGQERIYNLKKPLDAIRIDGLAQPIEDNGAPIPNKPTRRLSLWLSLDKARIPFRLVGETSLGPIEATLRSFQPGRAKIRLQTAKLAARR